MSVGLALKIHPDISPVPLWFSQGRRAKKVGNLAPVVFESSFRNQATYRKSILFTTFLEAPIIACVLGIVRSTQLSYALPDCAQSRYRLVYYNGPQTPQKCWNSLIQSNSRRQTAFYGIIFLAIFLFWFLLSLWIFYFDIIRVRLRRNFVGVFTHVKSMRIMSYASWKADSLAADSHISCILCVWMSSS